MTPELREKLNRHGCSSVIEYIEKLEGDNDSLAAHVQDLEKACRTVARKESRLGNYKTHIEALDLLIDKSPTASLAERDTEAFKAGAMRILNGLGGQSVEQAAAEYAKGQQAKV